MLKRVLFITFILFSVSCFKKPAKTNPVETLSLEEKDPAWTTNVPINLQDALAGKVALDLPNVLIKQQDGYEEFVLDILEPEFTFDWMLFKYHYPTPEMREDHEERIKIKYRFSRDGVDWSDWRYDSGTQFHDHDTTETFARRMINQRGPTASTPPQRYVEFKIISYTGIVGDTLLTNPQYSTDRYWRNDNTNVGRTVKKNNKITILMV